jgi:hypothetical protein
MVEQIKNGFQKMTVYLNKICDFLNDVIEQLMKFVLVRKGIITKEELNQYFTKKYKGINLIPPNVKNLFKTKSIEYLLKIHIESLAFFNNIKNDINNNKFQPLSKQSIAYEITKILENIYVKNKDANIKKYLMDLFKETEIPTLSPFFKKGYEDFKSNLTNAKLDELATKYGLDKKAFHDFIELIINRMIFDGEYLSDLLAPLGLGWKDRAKKELQLMEELIPILKKMAGESEISGLSAYE